MNRLAGGTVVVLLSVLVGSQAVVGSRAVVGKLGPLSTATYTLSWGGAEGGYPWHVGDYRLGGYEPYYVDRTLHAA